MVIMVDVVLGYKSVCYYYHCCTRIIKCTKYSLQFPGLMLIFPILFILFGLIISWKFPNCLVCYISRRWYEYIHYHTFQIVDLVSQFALIIPTVWLWLRACILSVDVKTPDNSFQTELSKKNNPIDDANKKKSSLF